MHAALVLAAVLAGSQAVGYQTHSVRDLSRPSIAGDDAGRLIQVSVWYPAAGGGKPMHFSDYVHTVGRYENQRWTEESKKRGIERFTTVTRDLGNGKSTIDTHIDKLLTMPVRARFDAPPAAGRFPMVVFPEYRPPANNSIVAEELASAGYVVVSVPLIGSSELDFENSVAGLETVVADIRVAIDRVGREPFADPTRLALLGLGISANINAAYWSRNANVDAFISLDGGVMSPHEVGLMRRTPFFDRNALRGPMLIIESPFEGADRSLLGDYRYADKTFVAFPTMKEFHYLNYGALEAKAPGIIGEAPPRVDEGFAWALRHMRAFLDRHLTKRDAAALPAAPEGLFSVSREAARSAAPTYVELKRMISERGIAEATALYERLKKDDPRPFRSEVLLDLYSHFAWHKDDDWAIRHGLTSILADSYPESSRAHFALANACRARSDKSCAKTHYERALAALPLDRDPTLDAVARQRIETLGRQRLGEVSD